LYWVKAMTLRYGDKSVSTQLSSGNNTLCFCVDHSSSRRSPKITESTLLLESLFRSPDTLLVPYPSSTVSKWYKMVVLSASSSTVYTVGALSFSCSFFFIFFLSFFHLVWSFFMFSAS
jgi:hypothetical protein